MLKIRSGRLYTCGKNVFWKEPKVCSPAHTLTHTQTHKHMSIPQPPPINILQPQPSGAPILQPQPAGGTILQPQPSENPVTQPQPVASSPQKEEKVTSIHLWLCGQILYPSSQHFSMKPQRGRALYNVCFHV